MGRSRLEDVTCAICYDSLFNKRDDLRDLIPIATCDCGHVFHEPCLLEWFRTQSEQYLAAAREQGIDGRFGSPTLSDAPAECPSCRAECFADPETGQPSIHRLFIDFDNIFDNNNNSIIGSSPPPSSKMDKKGKGNAKEEEFLNLARRAKGIREEVKGLNAESTEEHMEGMIRRGENLVMDLIGIQVLDTVKNYIEGLTKEIKTLRKTLESNPLNPGLRERISTLRDQIINLERQSRLSLQREVRKVKDEEQARCERKVKRAEEERDLLQRAYEKEKVSRKTGMRSMEERVVDLERRLEEMSEQLKKEKEDRVALQATLQERTQQLKLSTKRVEDRKDLKRQLSVLQKENDKLITRIQSHQLVDKPEIEKEDNSVQEISRSRFPRLASSPSIHAKVEEDESLQIDMPAYDDSFVSPDRLLPARTTLKSLKTGNHHLEGGRHGRKHPTARIMEFNLEGDKENKNRRRSTSSKYFPSSSSVSDEEESPKKYPIKKKLTVNEEINKRSLTNPFQTTKQSVQRRQQLPTLGNTSNNGVIDLTESPNSSKLLKKDSNTASILRLADRNGRPLKGVVSGQKMKRKF
ncbi:uncharacterized protein I206_107044 [Kwoniella pini CBS 10737]|uniref:RING-type domain-containing protein n=1 Tax=Kwoniella pini CBS 10737 TaxID=1296096 RepID=A0A1B9HZB8_9TREE|nr:uncharacterized protein I206_05413 [Kwoniella pini CBS 10737]OCF48633.1 hypothetical protein I206_05413 [Kwoniella pini CBS 10737]